MDRKGSGLISSHSTTNCHTFNDFQRHSLVKIEQAIPEDRNWAAQNLGL